MPDHDPEAIAPMCQTFPATRAHLCACLPAGIEPCAHLVPTHFDAAGRRAYRYPLGAAPPLPPAIDTHAWEPIGDPSLSDAEQMWGCARCGIEYNTDASPHPIPPCWVDPHGR